MGAQEVIMVKTLDIIGKLDGKYIVLKLQSKFHDEIQVFVKLSFSDLSFA